MKRIYLSCFFMLLLFSFIVNAQTPVAYYPFNGNANDAIGTNNGTANGGASLTTDRFGNANSAYNFDGVDDFISTANIATNQTDNWTMTAWVKPSSILQNNGTIVLNGFDNGVTGNGYGMVMGDATHTANGNLFKGLLAGVVFVTSGFTFSTNNIWYHTAIVREAGITKLYFNGVLSGTTSANIPNLPSGSLRIGSCTGIRFWSGAIDEVKIYNTALTALQVLADYNNNTQSPIPSTALQLWLKGDDGITKDINNKVSVWMDQSTNTKVAIQPDANKQPVWVSNVINGHAVVRYAAVVEDYFRTNYKGPNTGEVTMFVVAQGSNISSVIRFQNEVAVSSGFLIYGYTHNGVNNGFCTSNDGGDANGINCGFFNNSTLQIGTARWKANTTNGMQTFIDGALLAQRNSNNSVLPNDSLGIGSGNSSGNNPDENTIGDIAEIIIYDRALTDAERIQVETYLNIKYRVTNNLATSKPGSGNAISFNGSTQSISMPNSSAINFGTGDFSVDFWYNSLVSKVEIIFDKRDDNCADGPNWSILKDLAGQIFCEVNVPGPSSDFVVIPNVSDGKWHHIAFIRTATQISAFKDGILIESKAAVAQNVNNSAGFQLGSGPCGPFVAGGGFYSGSLDEIRLWNTALTQAQIRDRMCKKITSTDALYSNLVAYYNFDESTGTTAFDGTVNANNGTLTNTPARVTSGAAIGNASSHDYINATKTVSLTHTSGENLTVSSTSGLPAGIQVYMVDEKPNTLTGASGVGDNNKYFGVFQAGGTTPQYTAVYNYNGNPFVTPAIESQLRLNKRTDNAAASWTTMVAIPNEPANTITVTGESTEYILGKLGTPLPLSLISFTGSKNNNDALLQWKTANEIGVSKFEVQRSTNGQTFETIGTVAAGGSLYSLTDANAFSSRTVVYYRLKSIDTDGRVTYSSIIKLTTQTSAAITIYPNPVSDVLTIAGLKQNGTITLYNQEGKLLQQQTVSAQTTTMDMSKYAKGIYLLQYKTADEVVNQKIIKQ
jgi:hypothetical protein